LLEICMQNLFEWYLYLLKIYIYIQILNSIGFAYTTETDEKRNQLVKLINKYLKEFKVIEENILETQTWQLKKSWVRVSYYWRKGKSEENIVPLNRNRFSKN
jgi:hypothetical protein